MRFRIRLTSLRIKIPLLMAGLMLLTIVGTVGMYFLDYGFFSLTTNGWSRGEKAHKARIAFEEYLQNVHHEIHKEDVHEFCSQKSFDKAFITSTEQRYENITTGGIGPVFIAANLYNSENILPNMALQLLALADTLGHSRVFISIYENGSKDKTKEILGQFNSTLNALGIAHRIRTDEARRPEHIHRIEYLAKVRNLALEPLYSTGKKYDRVLFINDIYFCMNDLLELAYQSRAQSTHLTCAEDLITFQGRLGFYDTWVSRDMRGDRVWIELNRLSKDEITQQAQLKNRPFQVQCCWNGVALIDAQVFQGDDGLRFRRSAEGECSASECSLLCNDMWKRGLRRAIIVPRVKVSYDMTTRKLLREPVNFPADLPYNTPEDEKVVFRSGPAKVVCNPLNGVDTDTPDKTKIYVNI
ncbi:hypothetical protein H4S07_000176 [Coemansia furcata]|uniref:Uncharacterized protein n=1 Tax=Coemansia furcata TaxID=417177 RepID=A0ACC1LRH7_9FUNG|nr:hypothetical protein H4S07_000176 [Coemansia furcata]